MTIPVSTPSTPGCWMKSITAFGRQYVAISDGLHGQEVPLQFDSTNWEARIERFQDFCPNCCKLVGPGNSMVHQL
jgi:hypothetical protein